MDKIDEFVKDESDSIKSNYGNTLRRFFKFIGKDIETYFDNPNVDVIQEDIKYYITNQKVSSTTKNHYFWWIKAFMDFNDITLKPSFFKKMKKMMGKKDKITDDRITTKEELKAILSYGDIKINALILILSSSAIRIDELLQIQEEDIHFEETPTRIHIKQEYAKMGLSRDAFITEEATEKLQGWLKIRNEYLLKTYNKCLKLKHIGNKDLNDKSIFCFSYPNAKSMYYNLLIKAGLDEKDNGRMKLHLHTFRSYFSTNLKRIGITEGIVHKLGGWDTFQSKTYDKYTPQQLGELYKKCEGELTILSSSPRLKAEVNGLKSDSETHKKDIFDLQKKNEELENQLTKQTEKLKDYFESKNQIINPNMDAEEGFLRMEKTELKEIILEEMIKENPNKEKLSGWRKRLEEVNKYLEEYKK